MDKIGRDQNFGQSMHCGANCPGSEKRPLATPNHHSRLIFEKPIEIPISSFQWQGVVSMTLQVSAPARTPGRNVLYESLFGSAGGFTPCALQHVVVNKTKKVYSGYLFVVGPRRNPIGRFHCVLEEHKTLPGRSTEIPLS